MPKKFFPRKMKDSDPFSNNFGQQNVATDIKSCPKNNKSPNLVTQLRLLYQKFMPTPSKERNARHFQEMKSNGFLSFVT